MDSLRPVERTLGNGLRFLCVDMPHVHSVYVGVFARGGALCETRETCGISHLVEHLMMSQTARSPSRQELTTRLATLPGSFNASTSQTHLDFWLFTDPAFLPQAVEALAEITTIRSFPDDVLISEKRLLQNEIAHEGDHVYDDGMRQMLFGDGPGGRSVGGRSAAIRRLSGDVIHETIRRTFNPPNLVVVLCGRDADANADAVAARWGCLVRQELAPMETPRVAMRDLPRVENFRFPRVPANVAVGFAAQRPGSPRDALVMTFLEHNLLSPSARLFHDLRYGVFNVYHSAVEYRIVANIHYLCAHFRAGSRSQPSLCARFLAELRRVRDGDIPVEWFETGRANLRFTLEAVKDNPFTLGEAIGYRAVCPHSGEGMSFDDDLDVIRTMTIDDVVHASKRLFSIENFFLFHGRGAGYLQRRRELRLAAECLR